MADTPSKAAMEAAERALPCSCQWIGEAPTGTHIEGCESKHWPAVALAVDEVVAKEREACALIAENYDYEDAYDRIRARAQAQEETHAE
jgi:hypothetical protein